MSTVTVANVCTSAYLNNSGSSKWSLPTFLLANVQSMMNKLDDLYTVITNNNVGIACIVESWLNPLIHNDIVDIDGYICYRRDREDGRKGRGIACYVHSALQCKLLTAYECNDVESLWLLYRANRMPRYLSHIIIGVIYHPPNSNDFTMVSHIINSLDDITRDHPASPMRRRVLCSWAILIISEIVPSSLSHSDRWLKIQPAAVVSLIKYILMQTSGTVSL